MNVTTQIHCHSDIFCSPLLSFQKMLVTAYEIEWEVAVTW